MKKQKTISVIIPTLNEAEGIGYVLRKMPKEISEIIVVDGNSTDGTVEIAKKYGARIIIEKRRGYGRAYKTGFKYAKGKIIATLDGDGSYNPKDIIRLVDVLEKKKVDFVSGNRFRRLGKGSMSFVHYFGNFLISIILNILFFTKIYDTQSGMWVFYRNLLKKIKLKENGMSLSSEIKLEAYKKAKFLEYPIYYNKRFGKKKENTFKQGYSILRFLFKRRFSL